MPLLGLSSDTSISTASAAAVQNHVKIMNTCTFDCYQAALKTEPCNNVETCCRIRTFIKKSYECIKFECTEKKLEQRLGWEWLQHTCARTGHPIPPDFDLTSALTESTRTTSDSISSTSLISTTFTTTATPTTTTPSTTTSLSTPTATSDYHTGDTTESSRALKIALGIAIPLALLLALVTFICIRRHYLQKKRSQQPTVQGHEGPRNPPPGLLRSPTIVPPQPIPLIDLPGPIRHRYGQVVEVEVDEVHPALRTPPPSQSTSTGIQRSQTLDESLVSPLTSLSSTTLARSFTSPHPSTFHQTEAMYLQAQGARAPSRPAKSIDSAESGNLADDVRKLSTTLCDIQRQRTMR